MIHCHMLDHEDDGMMAQFAVLPPGQQALPAGFYLARDAPDPPVDPTADAATSMDGMSMDGMSMDGMSMEGTG